MKMCRMVRVWIGVDDAPNLLAVGEVGMKFQMKLGVCALRLHRFADFNPNRSREPLRKHFHRRRCAETAIACRKFGD